jgi:hypothetical protein
VACFAAIFVLNIIWSIQPVDGGDPAFTLVSGPLHEFDLVLIAAAVALAVSARRGKPRPGTYPVPAPYHATPPGEAGFARHSRPLPRGNLPRSPRVRRAWTAMVKEPDDND